MPLNSYQSDRVHALIMPKGFKYIGYYGLQATKSCEKWREAIGAGMMKAGILAGAHEIVAPLRYRERYIQGSGKDPLKCPRCGEEMMLWRIWHPKYGVIFSEDERDYKRGRWTG